MFKSRLLLSLVALSVSFCMSWIVTRDLNRSLLNSSITLVASFVGVAVADGRQRLLFSRRTQELKSHIQVLQRRRADAYESLVDTIEEYETTAHRLTGLQTQLRSSQPPNAELPPAPPAIPWKPAHKKPAVKSARPQTARPQPALSWNLSNLPPLNSANPSEPQSRPQSRPRTAAVPAAHLSEAASIDDSQRFDRRESRLRALELKEVELKRSLREAIADQEYVEQALKTSQTELNQVQAQVLEQQNYQSELAEHLESSLTQKRQLERQITSLQAQVQELEADRDELTQFLAAAEPERQQVESSSKSLQGAIEQLQQQIASLHGELAQLEANILSRRAQKEALDRELVTLRETVRDYTQPPPPVRAEPTSVRPEPALPTPPRPEPKLPNPRQSAKKPQSGTHKKSKVADAPALPAEWKAFLELLADPELRVLDAIVQEANPNATLKQIAEDQLTMPELLLDTINEHAIDTIGDLILDAGPGSMPIVVEEYLPQVKQLLAVDAATRSGR